jgi:mannose-6-phosphate isomerase class I
MLKKFRWSKVYESSEEELVAFLHSKKLAARRITAEEQQQTQQQISDNQFVIWCAEGSLVVRQNNTNVSLQPGDAITISPNVPYSLTAGIAGYVCYISH